MHHLAAVAYKIHFPHVLQRFAQSDAFVYYVFVGLLGEVLVGDYVLSPCAFVYCDENMIIFLLKHLVDVQGKVKAVLPGVAFDSAKRAQAEPLEVLAVEALLAFASDYLKGHEHYVLDLLVCRNVIMVSDFVLFI